MARPWISDQDQLLAAGSHRTSPRLVPAPGVTPAVKPKRSVTSLGFKHGQPLDTQGCVCYAERVN